jgi:hypothetical protein
MKFVGVTEPPADLVERAGTTLVGDPNTWIETFDLVFIYSLLPDKQLDVVPGRIK